MANPPITWKNVDAPKIGTSDLRNLLMARAAGNKEGVSPSNPLAALGSGISQFTDFYKGETDRIGKNKADRLSTEFRNVIDRADSLEAVDQLQNIDVRETLRSKVNSDELGRYGSFLDPEVEKLNKLIEGRYAKVLSNAETAEKIDAQRRAQADQAALRDLAKLSSDAERRVSGQLHGEGTDNYNLLQTALGNSDFNHAERTEYAQQALDQADADAAARVGTLDTTLGQILSSENLTEDQKGRLVGLQTRDGQIADSELAQNLLQLDPTAENFTDQVNRLLIPNLPTQSQEAEQQQQNTPFGVVGQFFNNLRSGGDTSTSAEAPVENVLNQEEALSVYNAVKGVAEFDRETVASTHFQNLTAEQRQRHEEVRPARENFNRRQREIVSKQREEHEALIDKMYPNISQAAKDQAMAEFDQRMAGASDALTKLTEQARADAEQTVNQTYSTEVSNLGTELLSLGPGVAQLGQEELGDLLTPYTYKEGAEFGKSIINDMEESVPDVRFLNERTRGEIVSVASSALINGFAMDTKGTDMRALTKAQIQVALQNSIQTGEGKDGEMALRFDSKKFQKELREIARTMPKVDKLKEYQDRYVELGKAKDGGLKEANTKALREMVRRMAEYGDVTAINFNSIYN